MPDRAFRSTFAAFLLLFAACDSPAPYESISAPGKESLERWAGVLARTWALPESDPRHPGGIDRTSLDSLIASCDAEPECWSYLYACISDTLTALEPPDPSCQRGQT